jgi:hypothetical protein
MDTELLALLADGYFATRNKRLAMQKEVDKLEEDEKKLKQQVLDGLVANGATAIGGKLVEISLVEKIEPTVSDIAALRAHIQATGEFDLLYNRINTAAVKERWQVHLVVPGVEGFPVTSLSMHARK